MIRYSCGRHSQVPPIFTLIPPPIRLDDTIAPGSVIARLEAIDADGSLPFNKVSKKL